jgi:peptidoglycan/LPS O-acetylase OafA/YrhL
VLYLHLNPAGRLSRTLSRQWLAAPGKWSYFLYVMHWPVLNCVAAAGGPPLMQPVNAIIVSLLCAWASWLYLESRLIAIGKSIPYAHSHRDGAPAGTTGRGSAR